MRVSDYYDLGVTQPALEFLDVDVEKDTQVFVDPFAFSFLNDDWARECVSLIQDFYDELLEAIRSDDRSRGLYLLSQLSESNEVHLGLSSDDSAGSGVADKLASEIYDALSTSEALSSGLLTDVQNTVLFVPGIGHDRISDMTVNIVRRQLISFTQRMAAVYGIELVPGLDSGPMWNRRLHQWEAEHVDLPMPNGKLLLVPRAVVRKTSTFDAGDYLTHFVLPYLQQVELLKLQSSIVQVRKGRRFRGERFVTKKDIIERDGKPRKQWNTEVTEDNPEILERYRDEKQKHTEPPGHDSLSEAVGTPPPDWDALLNSVQSIPSGTATADTYHRAVQNLLSALFYPALDFPDREVRIHEGRKRIDITYSNLAEAGFFHWLWNAGNVESGQVIVECKNYTDNLSNPEFDQLTGRFSPRRGRFGLLCYRGFQDKKSDVIKRCRDAALDDRGYVIALDDADLARLVQARKDGEVTLFRYLMDRFQELV